MNFPSREAFVRGSLAEARCKAEVVQAFINIYDSTLFSMCTYTNIHREIDRQIAERIHIYMYISDIYLKYAQPMGVEHEVEPRRQHPKRKKGQKTRKQIK